MVLGKEDGSYTTFNKVIERVFEGFCFRDGGIRVTFIREVVEGNALSIIRNEENIIPHPCYSLHPEHTPYEA